MGPTFMDTNIEKECGFLEKKNFCKKHGTLNEENILVADSKKDEMIYVFCHKCEEPIYKCTKCFKETIGVE